MPKLKPRPSIADVGLAKWIDNRAASLDKRFPDKAPHLRSDSWFSMVGPDPDNPKVDKANLMRAFDYTTRESIYRLLAQMKREMKT